MTRSRRRSPHRSSAALLAALVLAAAIGSAGPSRAADAPPQGVPAGPWVLAPSLVIGVARSSNPFYRPESGNPAPETEWVSRVNPNVRAILPFRNSRFEVSLDGSRNSYSKSATERRWSLTGATDLSLRLSSGDEVSFGTQRLAGVADILTIRSPGSPGIDPGGEAVYQGEGFVYTSYRASAVRRLTGQRGWSLELVQENLDFDETTASFFEFRGWQGGATYREPLSPALWFTGTWRARRFDNFLAASGEPYRRETSNDFLVGFEGSLGGRHSWTLRAGPANYEFERGQRTVLKTWNLDGQIDIALSEATRLLLLLIRRPYPSSFQENDYYKSTYAVARLEWTGPGGWSVGSSIIAGRNSYDLPAKLQPGDPESVSVFRRDRLARVDLYAKVPLGQRVGVVIAASHDRRSSTYPGDYDTTQLFGGMSFGWF